MNQAKTLFTHLNKTGAFYRINLIKSHQYKKQLKEVFLNKTCKNDVVVEVVEVESSHI